MKKAGVLILLVGLLFLVLSLNLIHAQDITKSGRDLTKDLEEKGRKITDESYLKQEWQDFVARIKNTPIIKFINPYIKFIFGIEFDLSWFFIFTVIIWFVFVIYTFRLFQGVSVIFESIFQRKLDFPVTWMILSILIVWFTKIAKIPGTYISDLIESFKSLPLQIIVVITLTFIFIYSINYSKLLKKFIVALKRKSNPELGKEDKKFVRKLRRQLE